MGCRAVGSRRGLTILLCLLLTASGLHGRQLGSTLLSVQRQIAGSIPGTSAHPPAHHAQAALEFLLRTGRQPDILHCHDWSTADVAKSYWTEYHHYGLWKPKVVS